MRALGAIFLFLTEAPALGEPADGRCLELRSTAASRAALLEGPELYGSAGVVGALDESTGAATERRVPRLVAGVRWSVGGLREGLATRALAEAECERQRILGELSRLLEDGGDGRARAARAHALEEAIPEAERLLAEARAAFERGRGTSPELAATRLRVDELKAHAAEARRAAVAASALQRPRRPLASAVSALRAADRRAARSGAAIRGARVWDLALQGGYERFLGSDASELPLFGVVTLSWNVGALWRGGREDAAAEGRRRALADDPDGVILRAEEAERRLASERRVDARRTQETAVLLADLERQRAALGGVEGEAARRFRETLWFEQAKLRAEHRYLEVRLEDLDVLLGPAP